ncbi:MAG: sugar phosphate nucleotidyltransferase [Saprospiraceae bacterium]|nr:sugar phosphate nucleotidyltransferase [Saprospiraceae bacterium]
MKAIIPVAGVGTNLRPHTFTQPKPLIPVAGKAIIAFIIDQLREAGVEEFIFVIGYLGQKIKAYVDEHYPDVHAEYVHQETRMGLGHAIWSTRELLTPDDALMIVLGDTILDVDLLQVIGNEHSCLGIKKVSDPRQFGVVELDDNGWVRKVIEKPRIPKSNLAMVGLYKIREVAMLMDCLDRNIRDERRTHGEYQLTDGIMCMIEKGAQFVPHEVDNWFDCGQKEILLETNATLLKRNPPDVSAMPQVDNSIVIPPVSIGKDCTIRNSIIGPHVSIGNGSNIDSSIIRDSIIGSYARIREVVLHHSIVGQDAAIRGLRQSLNIGDNTEIDLG